MLVDMSLEVFHNVELVLLAVVLSVAVGSLVFILRSRGKE